METNILMDVGVEKHHIYAESLILAQDERWRRA
jgi:hypothetical protein